MGAGGRPTKYKPEYNEQAYKLALLGATNEDLASFFNVSLDAIRCWRKREAEFSTALKNGKEKADAEVAQSLYKRALGFSCITQKAFKCRTGNGSKETVEVVDVVEAHPPDTTACIIWLKNRKPAQWREKKHSDEGDLKERELELYDAPKNGMRKQLQRYLEQ